MPGTGKKTKASVNTLQTLASDTPGALADLFAQLPVVTSLVPTVDPLQQGRLRSTIVELAHQLDDPQWGSEGTIAGTVTSVEHFRLWTNPMRAIKYSREEISAMSDSLRTEGQKTPLIVTRCKDPRPEHAGGTGGDILVIDGEKRYAAAPRALLTHLDVIFRDYPHIYAAMLDATIIKTTQHDLDEYDIGRSIMRLEIAYAITLEQHPDLLLPRLTDERLGAMIGRAQSVINRWRNLARLEGTTVDLLDAGAITPGQAIEMLPLTPEERVAVAEMVTDQNQSGDRPVPVHGVRQFVRERQRGPVQGLDSAPIRPPADLWMSGQGDYPSAVTIAAHIHDLAAWLEALMASLEHPHPDLVALLRTLRRPALQHQLDALTETAQQLLRHHITDE